MALQEVERELSLELQRSAVQERRGLSLLWGGTLRELLASLNRSLERLQQLEALRVPEPLPQKERDIALRSYRQARHFGWDGASGIPPALKELLDTFAALEAQP